VREKVFLLRGCGIEKVVVLKFNEKFSRTSAEDFFKNFVAGKCRARAVVVGTNFGFGRNREGDARFLERFARARSISVRVIPPLCLGRVPISSGRIRDALRAENLEEANRMLGNPYLVSGEVVRGRRLGKKIGFPTANISVPREKLLVRGVFAVRASLLDLSGKTRTYDGMCNVGGRPTIHAAGAARLTVEAHLFGFSGSLYGKVLKIDFLTKLRNEKAFPGIEELKDQIKLDKESALKALKAL
jgi:riboflavin kinase/FMN adenylyltransferase